MSEAPTNLAEAERLAIADLETFLATMRAQGPEAAAFADWYEPTARGYLKGWIAAAEKIDPLQTDLCTRIQTGILRSLAACQASLWNLAGRNQKDQIALAISFLDSAAANLRKQLADLTLATEEAL